MKFQPKSKEELSTMSLLKPGIYQFSVANAEDKVSRNGNEMIAITLEVYDDRGNSRNIYDYLLEAMSYKLFNFCEATKLAHHYHQGTLKASDCVGKSGYVELDIQKGRDKPEGGVYPDKNKVRNYMASKPAETASETKPKQTTPFKPEDFDDDIPF